MPTARNRIPLDVMTVGMPTPLAVLSKAAVTLFSTMKDMFLIWESGGMMRLWILLQRSMGLAYYGRVSLSLISLLFLSVGVAAYFGLSLEAIFSPSARSAYGYSFWPS